MDLPIVDVLVTTTGPPASLGATLSSLANQRYPSFRVTAARPPLHDPEVPQLSGLVQVLESRGHAVRLVDARESRDAGGRAQSLLDRAAAPYVLVVDDGIFLEADLLGRLLAAIRSSNCGFVGSNVVDLRFRDEHRPEEEAIEFWDAAVRPEEIGVESPGWARRKVHRGANLQHLRERLPRTRDRLYHVADIQGCILYDAEKLRSVGGFRTATQHAHPLSVPQSTVSAAQLRLLGRFGGAGLFPSGAYRLTPITSQPLPWPAPRPIGSAVAAGPRRTGRDSSGERRQLRQLGSARTDSRRHAGTPGSARYRSRGTG